MRDHIAAAAVKEKTAINPAEAARHCGFKSQRSYSYRCRDQLLCALRVQMHLSFGDAKVVSVATDGIRFGNPGKEYIIALAQNLGTGDSVVLTPKVLYRVAKVIIQSLRAFRRAFEFGCRIVWFFCQVGCVGVGVLGCGGGGEWVGDGSR